MKKIGLILLIACVVLAGFSQVADARCRRRRTVEQEQISNVVGLKLDAPNLVKIDKKGQWTLGAEGGKAIMKNIFYTDNAYYQADKGYFAFLKVTYKGCLLNCKEE